MEVKLTTDWILLLDSEIFCDNGKCYIKITDDGNLYYHLTELALKTLNVKYTSEELYEQDDEDFENPFYLISFDNIEDIKDSSPELYAEFQRNIKENAAWEERINKKLRILLDFLDSPKTLHQLHKHIENEFYKKEDDYEQSKKSLEIHTRYLVDELVKKDLVRKANNKYTRL